MAVYLPVDLAACIVSGEGIAVLGFIYRHPEVLLNLGLFSLASAVGQVSFTLYNHILCDVSLSLSLSLSLSQPFQLFIFTTITQLGPLTCSIFTTTRKFFTILGSVLLFANPLLPRQWLGVSLVFLGLLLDVFYGRASKPSAEKEKSNGLLPQKQSSAA